MTPRVVAQFVLFGCHRAACRSVIYFQRFPGVHVPAADPRGGLMQLFRSYRKLFSVVVTLAVVCIFGLLAAARNHAGPAMAVALAPEACANDDSGLKLPTGFCATVFADSIGHARHMVVSPSGVVYVNTWSGRYYGNDTPHEGGFL